MESDIDKTQGWWWDDLDFVAEMDCRMKSILDGTAKTLRCEEVKEKTLKGIVNS